VKVILLGTGGSTGVPFVGGADGTGNWGVCDPREPRNRRSRASIVVESDTGERLLVDTSPELRTQLLECRVPRIDALLFTHSHADHVVGLDDVRLLNRIVDRPIEAFANKATLEELGRRFGYAFRPWQPPGFFRPVLEPREVSPGETIGTAGMQVRLFEQDHGFSKSLGLRIGRFAYSTDVVRLDDAAFTALDGVDTWVVGCFLRRGPHRTHADLPQILAWRDRIRPRRTILTHMGTDMDWAWMQANLPAGVEAGHDGMAFELT
jgi:phosphoribosyl 1,2-cyclic phosphate phosphodiesterase